MDAGSLLIANAAGTIVCYLILWRMGARLKDVSFVDGYWSLGLVLLAWNSVFVAGPVTPRRFALAGLCTVWGLRLGAYRYWRWRSQGPQRRYRDLMRRLEAERGWGFQTASLIAVFGLQALLQFVVDLPTQLGAPDPAPRGLGPLAWVGLALGLAGVALETAADWRLARFQADPGNRGRVLATGPWRYSRHPNYFGDACVWWGIYMIAAETEAGRWSLPGPLLLTYMLMGGAPAIEAQMRASRPGYDDYARRTSAFIPWPPRA
jgi:steroid 5-alpha reductase family enzyme